jgi:hypothetical protein
MNERVKEIVQVEVKEEFRICPTCRYERGFHVTLIPVGNEGSLRMILLCPNCGARFDIGKTL